MCRPLRHPSLLTLLAFAIAVLLAWKLGQRLPTTVRTRASSSLAPGQVRPLEAHRDQEHHTVLEMPSLSNATIVELSSALYDGKISAVALTTAYLSRIREVNDYFHAVIETNPDALDIAHSLDQEQRFHGRRGPLHGIPILLKDIFVTLDKMETTSGSTAMLGTRPSKEAFVVRKLREAGVVILGKTNLSQWAAFRTASGGSGWSARGGLTLGAFHANMKTSGSSSGSAVSTILGLAAASIGAETDGSIISPASRAGVVGFKPTLGLLSTEGMIPLALQQDVPGPITRTVTDAAYLMDALVENSSEHASRSFITAFTDAHLDGIRVGVPTSSLPSLEDVPMATFRTALNSLSSVGAVVIANADFTGLEEHKARGKNNQLALLAGFFQSDIKSYLGTLTTNPNGLKDIGDIIRLTKDSVAEEYPNRGIDLLEMTDSIDTQDQAFKDALKLNEYFSGEGGIPGVMRRHNLDVLAIPAIYGPAVSFAARAGLPIVVVPLGIHPEDTEVKYAHSGPDNLVDVAPNIPFGIAFIGARGSERTLFRIAYTFEQLTDVRSRLVPFNLPTIELPNEQDVSGRL